MIRFFFSDCYTMEYHCRYFEALANRLYQYTDQCTVSFLNSYQKTQRNAKSLHIIEMSIAQKIELMERISLIASKYGLAVDTCAEGFDFSKFGITHAHCIDKKRLERIGGFSLHVEKDKNQRLECGCMTSVDIGMYHTCKNGCLYCYANVNHKTACDNFEKHHKNSPLLYGELTSKDVVTERKLGSCKNRQLQFFNMF